MINATKHGHIECIRTFKMLCQIYWIGMMKTTARRGHIVLVLLIESWTREEKRTERERYNNIISLCDSLNVKYSYGILLYAVENNYVDVVKLCKIWSATDTEIDIIAPHAAKNSNVRIVELRIKWNADCIDGVRYAASECEKDKIVDLCKVKHDKQKSVIQKEATRKQTCEKMRICRLRNNLGNFALPLWCGSITTVNANVRNIDITIVAGICCHYALIGASA